MNAVSCKELQIRIGSKIIFDRLDFSIKEGQFVGVFGPNGAGKTTFFKCLFGNIPYSHGKLEVLGQPPIKIRGKIGYVPQQRDIFPLNLTGRAFIATAIRGNRFGIPFLFREDQKEIDRVLALVDAKDLAQQPLTELSGGQRQRLLLAQALLGKPNILILDEPLNNIDPKWTQHILNLIKHIQSQQKLTVLLSTHDLNPLVNIIDQVLCLGNKTAILGKAEEVITSEILTDLYQTPMQVIKAENRIFVTSFT